MKILLADQHRDMLLMYRTLLEQRGDEIVTAFDGTQVADYLREEPFDLMILNADIPRVQSSQLLRMAKDRQIGTVSMVNAPAGEQTASSGGDQTVILFPFFPEELFAKIDEARSISGAGGGYGGDRDE